MKWVRGWFNITFLLAFVSVWAAGCTVISPIRIGFTAELTGKQNELAINLRNGVQLAVEDINAGGGINGRKIELFIEDDQGTAEGATFSRAEMNALLDLAEGGIRDILAAQRDARLA